MGNTELILSTNRDVINLSCIQCKFSKPMQVSLNQYQNLAAKMTIHHFDDHDPLQHLISPSSWFYRFTLTWKSSMEPTKGFSIVDVSFYCLIQ